MFLQFTPWVLECSIKCVRIVWNFHCSTEDFSFPNPGRRCSCGSTNIKSYFILFILIEPMTLMNDDLSFSGVSSSDVFSTWHPVERLFSEGTVPGNKQNLFVFLASDDHLQKRYIAPNSKLYAEQ